MTTRWLAVWGAVVAAAVTVAGCGSPQSSNAAVASLYRSPEQATLSWFYAINHKDKADAVAHFTRAAAGQMDWGDTSTWSTFSALRCRPTSLGAVTASVYCTFSEPQTPAVGNPDSFWTIHLQRQPDGRWLIDNYGQG